jgi:hypothetical protein
MMTPTSWKKSIAGETYSPAIPKGGIDGPLSELRSATREKPGNQGTGNQGTDGTLTDFFAAQNGMACCPCGDWISFASPPRSYAKGYHSAADARLSSARTHSWPDLQGRNVHPSHWRVITVVPLPSSVLIKVTRRAYFSATETPDAKSFVRNILSISSLKPKILARSRV